MFVRKTLSKYQTFTFEIFFLLLGYVVPSKSKAL